MISTELDDNDSHRQLVEDESSITGSTRSPALHISWPNAQSRAGDQLAHQHLYTHVAALVNRGNCLPCKQLPCKPWGFAGYSFYRCTPRVCQGKHQGCKPRGQSPLHGGLLGVQPPPLYISSGMLLLSSELATTCTQDHYKHLATPIWQATCRVIIHPPGSM